MERQKLTLKLLGITVILFTSFHLLLNIYVSVISLFLQPDEVGRVMGRLVQALGPIAVQEDRNPAILAVKVTVSALFLMSGIGIFLRKEIFRKLLFFLLAARICYGVAISIIRYPHPHLAIIIAVGIILFYYLSRAKVKAQFR